MQITEFLRLIGGLYYYSYSCITKKWITWIYAEKLHFETFFLQDEPLLLHSKLNQAQHVKSRIQPKLKEWMVENIIKGHLRNRNPTFASCLSSTCKWYLVQHKLNIWHYEVIEILFRRRKLNKYSYLLRISLYWTC